MGKKYHSSVRETCTIYRIPAKVYVIDLLGRDPEVYTWNNREDKIKLVLGTLEINLSSSESAGIPHVITTMPHFTRCFRFGDPRQGKQETNVYSVGLFDTNELLKGHMEPLNREAIGCLGELDIFGKEARLWAESNSVETYLATFVQIPDLEVSKRKLSHLISD